jgi:type IV pilus assembly protein PilA
MIKTKKNNIKKKGIKAEQISVINKMNFKNKFKKRGFTLIELMVALGIMAVVIGVVAPNMMKYINRSKQIADEANAKNIYTAATLLLSTGDIQDSDITSAVSIDDATNEAMKKLVAYLQNTPKPKSQEDGHFSIIKDTNKGILIKVGTKQVYPAAESTSTVVQ